MHLFPPSGGPNEGLVRIVPHMSGTIISGISPFNRSCGMYLTINSRSILRYLFSS